MEPDRGVIDNLDKQGRKADQKAGELHDEGRRPVAGLYVSEIVATGLADWPHLQKSLEQGAGPAMRAPAKQTGPDRVDPGRRKVFSGWRQPLQPKAT